MFLYIRVSPNIRGLYQWWILLTGSTHSSRSGQNWTWLHHRWGHNMSNISVLCFYVFITYCHLQSQLELHHTNAKLLEWESNTSMCMC